LRDEIQKADKAMEKVRKRLADIELDLSRPEMYEEQSRTNLQELLKEQGELRGQLDTLEETWMLASEELEVLQEAFAAKG
jgi:ATP-binding cassette subfamily F protein 3